MRTTLFALAAAVAFVTAPAFAEDQQQSLTDDQMQNAVICKQMPSATGSRLGAAKECHTRREWEERRQADRQMLEKAQGADRRGPPGG